MKKKLRSFSTVILNPVLNFVSGLFQNLYRFRVSSIGRWAFGPKPGMTKKTELFNSFFPQDFRKKTAKIFKNWKKRFFLYFNRALKISFLFFVFCFLFLNLHSQLFPENEELSKAKRTVLSSPFNSKAHLGLAKVYLEAGNLEGAEKELSLSEGLTSTNSQDLKSAKEALEKAKERPKKIRQEIEFWQEIIKEKQDYRDAYFQLAVLNYQIYQKGPAVKYLQKTLNLDPNFEPAKKLEKLLNP